MLETLVGHSGGRTLGMQSASREEAVQPAPPISDAPSRGRWRTPGRALLCFIAAEVVAFPLMLVWGRHGWFTQDDWDFLSARTIGNAGDLFRPHFQHWTTLPILPYRLLWTLVGIRSYVPYQALVVALHLVAAALLLAVMRRAGVRPWLATIAAVVFVYYGSGAENILVAFQITFVGALVFGLAQLLLADHDGPLDRRDWLGLLAGLAGLMCSGVSITMTAVVGVALLLRRGPRGWRVALFHTAPLAAVYLLWLELAPKGQSAGNYRSHSPMQVFRFAVIGVEAAFARLGQIPGVGLVLGAVLVAGLVVAFRAQGRALFGRYAAPVALLAGGVVFLLATGVVRAGQGGLLHLADGTGPERARDSRYVYLVAAMALPALALAADALIRRWNQLTIPVVVVLLLGVPGNIHRLSDPSAYFANTEATSVHSQIVGLPRLPLAEQLRSSRIPVPIQYPRFALEGLTFGWLIDGAESGRFPGPESLSPVLESTRVLQSFLVAVVAASPAPCRPAPVASILQLEKGQKLTVAGGNLYVRYVPLGGTPSLRLTVKPSTVIALVGPLRLRLVPTHRGVMICN